MKSEIHISKDGKSVFKTCRNKDEFERELKVYALRLDFTPQFIGVKGELTIELERICGTTISYDIELDFKAFANVFASLHLKTADYGKVICHIDTNPRNYLIRDSDAAYYMIDFSESAYSFPEHDLINFLLFFASSYEPARFQAACKTFLTSYNNIDLLNEQRLPLFRIWMTIFDRRRDKYRKKTNTVTDRQLTNRQYMLTHCYGLLSKKA